MEAIITMKKILAILLAIAMTFSMVISVAAADVSGKLDEAEGAVSDVYDAASDAYDAAASIKDNIQAGNCDEAVSGAFTFAKALANAIHTLVHRLSELFDFDCPFCDGTGLDKDEPVIDDEPQFSPDAVLVASEDELQAAIVEGGEIVLTEDIELSEMLVIEAGTEIVLNMNGKTISLPDGADASLCDPMIDMRRDGEIIPSLVIDGDGTFDLGANPGFSFIFPRGDLTINSGTFKIDTGLSSYGSFFVGMTDGRGKIVINGGYFDGGYYVAGDCFNNCRNLLNVAWGQAPVRVYGGTFVAQNPAWGDEGLAHLCTCCGGGSYCQGLFLEGQSLTDTTMPAGYSITEGTTPDGRPTYTVNYSK